MSEDIDGLVRQMENESGRKRCSLSLVAVTAALAVGLPFLDKPFHIDDPVVLAVAEQICRDPLRPFSFDFHWFSDPEPIFGSTTNPPFLSYWLAPVVAMFGPSERALHLAMLPFLIILGLAAGSLSKRFVGGSVWPVLYVLFCPAVVVSSNIMRDVPATALTTGAVALFVAGTDRDRWLAAIGGALLAGLAMVTKYSALFILPVLVLYPILQRKPRYLLAILAALAVVGLWYLQNYLVHGQVHFFYLMSKGGEAPVDRLNKLTATLVITGASFFLLPGLLAGAVDRRDGATPGGAIIVAIAAALLFVVFVLTRMGQTLKQEPLEWHLWPLLQYNLWAILGAVLIYWLVAAGLFANGRWWTRPADSRALDALFLFAWLLGPHVVSVFFVGFPAVRHVMPAVAPAVLLAVAYTRRVEGPSSRWVGFAFGIGLVAQMIVGFWTAAADYQYADTYRQFAREAAEKPDPPAGNEIWFHGHWGWQHYCTAAGFRHISEHGQAPKAGDIVLEPEIVHRMGMPPGLRERLEKIDEKTYPARLGIMTMDWAYAGFYATFGVTMPQRFCQGRKYETFRVYRVKPAAESPG